MVKQNPNLAKLKTGYLFPEINLRKQAFLKENPGVSLIGLGIGDTTQPIGPSIAATLAKTAAALATPEGYTGYGAEQGDPLLRRKISEKIYRGAIRPEEIFISDGAKCDAGRLQWLFPETTRVAVQDPSYPVYVDTSLISGKWALISMPCTPANGFFPNLEALPDADLYYICSPNNPTGGVARREQLKELIQLALQKRALILFDAAYGGFIQDPALPRTIFEIEGAREVAIELNSFSKMAGFTGVRLGWSVVPQELHFEEGSSVHSAWSRINSTFFNGASNLAQKGGCAVLEEQGWNEIQRTMGYYLENAQLIKETFISLGFPAYGGEHAPFVWVDFSPQNSWEAFDRLLKECNVVSTPGSGFGACGEGFIRFSALASRENTLEALGRIVKSSLYVS